MYAQEGEAVREQFRTPNARGPLTWAASGLPRGLAIDPRTGVIAGRPQYDQAGDHPVELTARAGNGDRHSVGFTWVVRDTPRWPWVDDQVHRVGEPVRVPAAAHDEVGNRLTSKVHGLPPGVKYEDGVGFVGAAAPGADGTYHVTAQVTGGGATDRLTFRWAVIPADRAAAAIAINGTFSERDDVGAVGHQSPVRVKYFLGGSARGPIKVAVTAGPAALTTEKGDLVGTPSLTFHPVDLPVGWLDLYSIVKEVGQIEITAFHWVDGNWVTMDGSPSPAPAPDRAGGK
jgi:hypothetical protein